MAFKRVRAAKTETPRGLDWPPSSVSMSVASTARFAVRYLLSQLGASQASTVAPPVICGQPASAADKKTNGTSPPPRPPPPVVMACFSSKALRRVMWS